MVTFSKGMALVNLTRAVTVEGSEFRKTFNGEFIAEAFTIYCYVVILNVGVTACLLNEGGLEHVWSKKIDQEDQALNEERDVKHTVLLNLHWLTGGQLNKL